MNNLLKSEFYKLKKSKSFYILLGVNVLLALTVAFAHQAGANMESGAGNASSKLSSMVSEFGGAWLITESLNEGILPLIIAIFVSIFVSADFNLGTIKNTVSKGFNRQKIYFVKFIISSLTALIMLTVFILTACITGTLMWGFDPNGIADTAGLLTLFLTQSLMIIAYVAIFVFISMSLRSSGSSIGLNICVVFLLGSLLQAFNLILGGKIDLGSFWISDNMTKLITFAPASTDLVRGIAVALAYILVSTILGIKLFQKQDIK